MLVNYNWLKDYVDLDLAPDRLADRLTMCGLEVDELRHRYDYLEKVVVGRVSRIEDHPRRRDA